ncbi:MAG: FeoB-associated Cys-rich membrane protein [Eggerthellaceae bacterium]|jgi:primosomal protein N'
MGTLFVVALLVLMVSAIIVHMVKQHRKGLSVSCSDCSAAETCPHCFDSTLAVQDSKDLPSSCPRCQEMLKDIENSLTQN